MLAQCEISDLFDMLCESELTYATSSTDDLTDVFCRKRRSRRRYETPKVFKNDVRWSYSNMFINVLSSSDVYMMHDFLSTYAVSELLHVNHLKSKDSTEYISKTGIAAFLKHWFVSTCVAPDITYAMSNPSVKNLTDGSSEISIVLTIRGNFIYEKPQLEESEDSANSPGAVVVGQKRKFLNFDKNRNGRISNGRRLVSYERPERVRVGEYSAARNSYICGSLLEELDSIVLKSFSSQPVSVVSSGTFTMRLDSGKRIISTLFESIGSTMQPIDLSQI